MNGYIDIHTHKTGEQTHLSIRNFYSGLEQSENGLPCSLGIHPWYIHHNTWQADFEKLAAYALQENVYAIGECGLDKLADTDWELQQLVFRKQIALAGEVNKPLVIHCVRAFEEVRQLLKESKVTVPVIFHGFNKNKILAERLLIDGYFLSFGSALLKASSPAMEVLQAMDVNRMFLETDDADLSIEAVYESAAKILEIAPDSLILQVQNNFKTVFKR